MRAIKLVAMKMFSKKFLDASESHRVNLKRELECLEALKKEDYCLKLHEHLVLDDCEILVTDLIIGDDLYTMR